jgi:hypothetical protein
MACVQTHPQATDLLCPWGCLHFAQALIRFETFPDERKSERCGHDSSKTQYLDRGNIDQGFSQNYERRVKDGRHEITGARAPNRFLSSNFRKLLMGARSSVTRRYRKQMIRTNPKIAASKKAAPKDRVILRTVRQMPGNF